MNVTKSDTTFVSFVVLTYCTSWF